jgi:hypothetical protein
LPAGADNTDQTDFERMNGFRKGVQQNFMPFIGCSLGKVGVTIPSFISKQHLVFYASATHFQSVFAVGKLDFAIRFCCLCGSASV